MDYKNQNLSKLFVELKKMPVEHSCKRKTVRCGIYVFDSRIVWAHNGSSINECTNEVGNCGCAHAEPKAILKYIRLLGLQDAYMICEYSPCTHCANFIIESKTIEAVYYDILTEHDTRGAELLQKAGIECSSLSDVT
jgi:deoxycytidylate deaminase